MLATALLLASLAATLVRADTSAQRSTVLWTPETYATMNFLYARITAVPGGVEFAACLRARRDAAAWIVTEVAIPPQRGNTPTGIESASCDGYEGAAHSHPLAEGRRACFPSMADRATFLASSNAFLVIWCDAEAFTYRTRDLGIGGKDDVIPDPKVSTSAEAHIWRHPYASPE